jgi:hypothetical protein
MGINERQPMERHNWEDVEEPLKQVCKNMCNWDKEDPWDLINAVWCMDKFHKTPLEPRHILYASINQCVRMWRREIYGYSHPNPNKFKVVNPISLCDIPLCVYEQFGLDTSLLDLEEEEERDNFFKKISETLTSEQTSLLFDVYYKGKTVKMQAEELGLCIGTVKTRRYQARKKLKEAFLPAGGSDTRPRAI